MLHRKPFIARWIVATALILVALGLSGLAANAAATGVIYLESSSVVGKVNADGTGYVGNYVVFNNTGWDGTQGGFVHASYLLHNGKRWFVESVYKNLDPSGLTWQSALILQSDHGDVRTFPFAPDIDNQWASAVGVQRFVPGDAEISLPARSASTGAVGLFALPITWDLNGNPSLGAPYLKMTTPSFVSTGNGITGSVLSVVGHYDWDPSGANIVFRSAAQWSGEPLANGLYTFGALFPSPRLLWSGGNDTPFGWSATNRICFPGGLSLYTANPDGSGRTTVFTSSSGLSVEGGEWSPDASRLVFAYSQGGKKGFGGLWTIASSGGTATTLINTFPGWYDWR